MTDAELELAILRIYSEQHDEVGTNAPNCARELDMKEVISRATGRPASEEVTKRWHARLAPRSPPYPKGLLRPCSDSTVNSGPHKFHARAYYESGSAPAWERISQLESQLPAKPAPTKEKEQKFGLVCSLRQASHDFASYCTGLRADATVGVLFLDIDNFKALNTRFTEVIVDQEILAPFQKLLCAICTHRGEAYRHGGEEFLILLPNQTAEEVVRFAERLREKIAVEEFSVGGSRLRITVSIGIALYPKDGTSLEVLIANANTAEHEAKDKGKNRIKVYGIDAA